LLDNFGSHDLAISIEIEEFLAVPVPVRL